MPAGMRLAAAAAMSTEATFADSPEPIGPPATGAAAAPAPAGQPVPGSGTPPLAPGDQAAPGTPGTGEDICPQCGGSGADGDGAPCPHCAGSGKIIVGIGGA